MTQPGVEKESAARAGDGIIADRDSVIVLGAHLDSCDLGTGAHDDATGIGSIAAPAKLAAEARADRRPVGPGTAALRGPPARLFLAAGRRVGRMMRTHMIRHSRSVLAGLLLAATPTVAVNASPDGESAASVPAAAEACLSCHAIAADEPALEGPTLWGVVGRRIASAADFEYSDALRRQQGAWDRAQLDRFLAAPQAFAPGTQMTLGGVRNAADRTAVIDFLETLR